MVKLLTFDETILEKGVIKYTPSGDGFYIEGEKYKESAKMHQVDFPCEGSIYLNISKALKTWGLENYIETEYAEGKMFIRLIIDWEE